MGCTEWTQAIVGLVCLAAVYAAAAGCTGKTAREACGRNEK